MPHSDYTTEVCRNCRDVNIALSGRHACTYVQSVDEPENCPYRMAREGRTLPPVPSSPQECTDPEQKRCTTCGHNYGLDGKIKLCGQKYCTWSGREGWIPYVINEPAPVVVTASRFYTPMVEDEMKEIRPTIVWEE